MSGSYHIRSVEIVVELGIFVFFLIFRLQIIQITLIEFGHFDSMKVSRKAKFGHSIFQVKIKRKQTFQVQQQFQYFEYDMNQTKHEESMPSILLQLNSKPLKRTLLNNNS